MNSSRIVVVFSLDPNKTCRKLPNIGGMTGGGVPPPSGADAMDGVLDEAAIQQMFQTLDTDGNGHGTPPLRRPHRGACGWVGGNGLPGPILRVEVTG